MILRDKITALDAGGNAVATLAAHVGTTDQAVITGNSTGVEVTRGRLKAMVRPTDYAATGARWRWRGVDYQQTEPATVRRRGGRDHHYTLALEVWGEA